MKKMWAILQRMWILECAYFVGPSDGVKFLDNYKQNWAPILDNEMDAFSWRFHVFQRMRDDAEQWKQKHLMLIMR